MPFNNATRVRPRPKRTLAILIACLVLVVYIGILMASNYQNQIALGESTLERFRLDLEKRAASLGYFFSERKFDLRSLAASREVYAYFVNKSLGMSEQYGLKVSFFVIGQIFEKTIREKSIQSDEIYERILFVDRRGRPLVDTAPQGEGSQVFFWDKLLTPQQTDPAVFVEDKDGRAQILIFAPCFYKGHFAGELIAWLNLDSVFRNLVDFPSTLSKKNVHLAGVDGLLICRPGEETGCLFATHLAPDRIKELPVDSFSSFTISSDTKGRQNMLLTRLPIHNTPLNLLAWAPRDEIYGSLTPWQLLVGTGSLALVILVGIGLLMRFNTQNLILKAHELGYGSCVMDAPLLVEDELRQMLDIPRNQRLITVIPLGLPAHLPRPPRRRGIAEVVRYVFVREG